MAPPAMSAHDCTRACGSLGRREAQPLGELEAPGAFSKVKPVGARLVTTIVTSKNSLRHFAFPGITT